MDEILTSNPNDVDGIFFRSRVNLAENNIQKAIEDLTIVTRNAPKFSPGFYFLGLAQARQNQIDEAKKSFAKAAELAPGYLNPRISLAQLHLATGEHAFALAEAENILKARPNDETALQIKGAAEAKKGDVDKALATFQRVAKINPKNPSAHVNLGAVYTVKKKYPEALKEYEEALRLDPNRLDALGSLAQVYILQNNSKAAFQRVEQQLGKAKHQAGVYQLLGQLSIATKDNARGIEYLEKAIQINPDLSSAYVLIGNVYAAEKKFDTAIEQYMQVSKKNPKAIQPLMMTGILYEMKKQPQKANEYYQKVLDLNRNFAPAANNLAYNYAQYGGNVDIALGLAQKARELDPNDPNTADTLGWIQYKKGSYGMSLELLKESNEKFKSSNPTVLYHLGLAYQKNGDPAKAREALTKALAVSQSFPEAQDARKALQALP